MWIRVHPYKATHSENQKSIFHFNAFMVLYTNSHCNGRLIRNCHVFQFKFLSCLFSVHIMDPTNLEMRHQTDPLGAHYLKMPCRNTRATRFYPDTFSEETASGWIQAWGQSRLARALFSGCVFDTRRTLGHVYVSSNVTHAAASMLHWLAYSSTDELVCHPAAPSITKSSQSRDHTGLPTHPDITSFSTSSTPGIWNGTKRRSRWRSGLKSSPATKAAERLNQDGSWQMAAFFVGLGNYLKLD